jgi:hypothetical protein
LALPDEATPQVPRDALPFPIFCRGVDKTTGRRCRTLLCKVEHGLVIFRRDGFEIPDPPSVKCGRCGQVRAFRGGVPEELGGSSGVLRRQAS